MFLVGITKRHELPRCSLSRSTKLRLEALEDRTLLSWSSVAPLPAPRFGIAVAMGSDGRIYALGGTDANLSSLTTATRYRVDTNQWETVASLVTAESRPAGATGADGRVYAIGGNSFFGASDAVQAIAVNANVWNLVANQPVPRSDLAAVAAPDGRIYAIGGNTFFGITNLVHAYSPATNSWITVANMPTSRSDLAATLGPDGRIYAIGGTDSPGHVLNTVEAYSPILNSWTTVAALPTARMALAAATGPDGLIYAIGGADAGGNPLTTVEAYSTITHAWITAASLPTARSFLGAATGPDGRIYAVGGKDASGNPLATVEALTVGMPDPRNPAFVAQLYLDLLHRPANDSGAMAFLDALNSGLVTRTQIALSIESSAEYKTDQINAIYETLLHRPVDPVGLNSFLGFLAAGGTYEQVQAMLAGSAEFFTLNGGTNDGFLNALYQDALNRVPDAVGRAEFSQFLAQGGSRTQVAVVIFTSLEFDTDLVGNWYVTFLRRAADENGLNGFVAALMQGVRDETLIAAIVGSDEYIARL